VLGPIPARGLELLAQPTAEMTHATAWPIWPTQPNAWLAGARWQDRARGVFPITARPGMMPMLERRSWGVRRRSPLTPDLTVGDRRQEEVEARWSVTSWARWRLPRVAPSAHHSPRPFSYARSGCKRGGDALVKVAIGELGGDGERWHEIRVSEPTA
jgi:hypothetical protein